MKEKNPVSEIEQRLTEIKDVPFRNPQMAARGRARFLSEAAKYRQAVSPAMNERQSGWTFLIRKENFAMNALVSLILATALIFGGGATAVAAQDDLPNEPLYQVKLWTENATLALTGNPQAKANLLMNMAQTRVNEMAALTDEGVTAPVQVRERLQQEIEQTLKLASGMDDADLTQTLLQLRDRLQTQDRIMQQLQTHVSTETEPLLTQTRQMLQIQLQLVDQGLADPQGFRYTMNNQMQYGTDETVSPEPNQQGEPGFHQNDSTEQPGTGNGESNGASGGQNPDNQQNGSGNGTPGGQNPDNGSGSQYQGGQQGDSGSGSGGGN